MINTNKVIVGPWVARKLTGSPETQGFQAIGLERGGEIVAGVIYENCNGVSCVCHIAVEGLMTPRYLAVIFDYPFVQLGLTKIIAPVNEGNAESIRFVSKLGFREEARLHDAGPDGSILLFTLNRKDCRFIKENYRGKIERTGSA